MTSHGMVAQSQGVARSNVGMNYASGMKDAEAQINRRPSIPDGTNPTEAILWLNGAMELCGDAPPTPEQWAKMKEKVAESVGFLAKMRFTQKAEEQMIQERRDEAERQMKEAQWARQQAYERAMQEEKMRVMAEMVKDRSRISFDEAARLTGLIGKAEPELKVMGLVDPNAGAHSMAGSILELAALQETSSSTIGARLRNLVTKDRK